MGMWWVRVRPKPNVSIDRLEERIQRQQLQCQHMVGMWWTFSVPLPTLAVDLTHSTASIWADADDALKELLEFPEHEGDYWHPLDINDLQCGWHTGVVKYERRFPPLWRLLAVRSFSPRQLKNQFEEWNRWRDEVRDGKHRAYLESLFLFECAATLREHWSTLRERAIESLGRTNNWAQKPEFQRIRDEILYSPELLQEMPCSEFGFDQSLPTPRILPDQERLFELSEAELQDRLELAIQSAKRLCRLTRNFDAIVKQHFKVRWYENCYNWSLDEFIAQPKTDANLEKFLEWCRQCFDREFGLYLDY